MIATDPNEKPPLLSKSTFIAAYDCPVRLLHKRSKMASGKTDDDFLGLLAEGGMQFECLVRVAYPGVELVRNYADPHGCHAESMSLLKKTIESGKGILHEPTFVAGPYSARVDMLRVTGNRIELCEIKAKSFAGPVGGWDGGAFLPVDFPNKEDNPQIVGVRGGVASSWLPYVADVAFQKVVLERALLEAGINLDAFVIVPALVLVNKRAHCSELDARANVYVEPDSRSVAAEDRKMKDWKFATTPPDGWRSPLIAIVDVTTAAALLREGNAKSKAARWEDWTLDRMMDDAAGIYRGGIEVDPCDERGWKCRDCEYNGDGGERDGFNHCWGSGAPSARNLTTLYYGKTYADPFGGQGGRWVHLRVDANLTGVALTVADLDDDPSESARGLRRTQQMQAERSGQPVIGEGLAQVVQTQLCPIDDEAILYFIDFETSMSCLPHYVSDRPYQVVPFQFSCHAVAIHAGVPNWDDADHREWLFPHEQDLASIDMDRLFADELQRAVTAPLSGITDTTSSVFHWATHERTVLKQVRRRLKESRDSCDTDRIAFFDSMVGGGKQKTAGRLVDMLNVAQDNVFHHLQKGRFSIKQFLPAICADAEIRAMVKTLVTELKDDGAAPIGEAWDPYKALPAIGDLVAGEYTDPTVSRDESDVHDGNALSSGTDAMLAFAALRYGADGMGRTWNESEKQQLREALYVYCKLDTAAMVAVWRWLDEQV